MTRDKYFTVMQNLFAKADVQINGPRPWDIQVKNPKLYERIVKQHTLGAGEAYMDGWWDCEQPDAFFDRCLSADLPTKAKKNWWFFLRIALYTFFNIQTRRLSTKVAQVHYNLDNELYRHMLGESMAYTCAYWKDASTLTEAQHHKYELVCKKLSINENDHVLELGCGWGGFARYASMHYGCKVVAINIADEQIRYAKNWCANLPIEFYLADYRDMNIYNSQHTVFDKVVSIGLCEHIGYKNYPTLMHIAHQQLKNNGLFLLHTIGNNFSVVNTDPWISKYIFPHGMLPSIKQLGEAMEKRFVMEDWHNFGADYDKTLMAWFNNFKDAWPILSKRFDERFYRMWTFYLLSSAGLFRSRAGQLWQIVLSKNGIRGGYQSIR